VVDKTLILRKLAELEEYLGQVKEYANITAGRYSKDWKAQRVVERTLQMMIETCADVAGHIISDRGYRVPATYADTLRVLHENGLLNKELFETMEKMAKLRNIIIHHYDKVDAEIVSGILKKDLKDFRAYLIKTPSLKHSNNPANPIDSGSSLNKVLPLCRAAGL
jgi:uncharacterized protein YutE (UPF0331/DUF86 family)